MCLYLFLIVLISIIMFINPEDAGEVRSVNWLSEERENANAIHSFLQGAVYCWCKNNPNEWFSIRDFMGGANYYWEGTPLMRLYEKHEDEKAAGQDAGKLLKKVINDDKRRFKTKREDRIRKYKWVGDEI